MLNQDIINNADKFKEFMLRFVDKDNPVIVINYERWDSLKVNSDTKHKALSYSNYGFCIDFGKDKRKLICLNEDKDSEAQLYVMAHEIAHLFLGHANNKNKKRNNAILEWEANLFAGMMMFLINGALPYTEYFNSKTNTNCVVE